MEKSTQFSALEKKVVKAKVYDQEDSYKNPLYSAKTPPQYGTMVWSPWQAEAVPVDKLRSTQELVDPGHAMNLAAVGASKLPPVDVYQHKDGHFWVADGNHRAVAARLRGDSTVIANVKRPR